MKKIMRILLLFSILPLVFGCSLFGIPEFKSLADDLFYQTVKKVAPVFDAFISQGLTSRAVSTWDLGDPIYELYGVLNDGEAVGYFNLYALMNETDFYFTDLGSSGAEITEQAVNAPFDVGFNGNAAVTTYNTFHEYEGTDTDLNHTMTFGKVDENNIVYILYTDDNNNDAHNTKKIVQGWYDQNTGDLELGLFMANETEIGWELIKAFVAGNAENNTFSLKIIRNGAAYDHNITGYGVSKGTGNYFLLKLANNTMDFSLAMFYQFAAESTVEELKAMDTDGLAAPPAETTDYEANLPANYTSADLPTPADAAALNVMPTYTP